MTDFLTYKRKVLILGGASAHVKLVEAAKSMNLETIVSDNLPIEKSPGKQIADKSWDLSIYDTDAIIQRIQKEQVDAVISGWIDRCQRPYAEICDRLKLPCFGSPEQFFFMTDKHAFKRMCRAYGVPTVKEYTEEDVVHDRAEYPVFIKPDDSCGSQGQNLCINRDETVRAIMHSKLLSSTGSVIIEKYMQDVHEIQVTYFVINGTPFLIRTADSYKGRRNSNLDNVVVCSVSPSIHTEEYLSTTHKKVIQMLKGLGLKNGPVFLQGFYDNGVFRFFDPGLRFPGVEYDRVYQKEYGIDLMSWMIQYAFQGKMPQSRFQENLYELHGKRAAIIFPVIKPGIIHEIHGIVACRDDNQVYSVVQKYKPGDIVKPVNDTTRRIAEVDLISDNTEVLRKSIDRVQSMLSVLDVDGNEMKYEVFDTNRLQ